MEDGNDSESYTVEEQFIDAARLNDVRAMRQLVAYVKEKQGDLDSLVNARDPDSGATALHMAAANGHSEALAFLTSECVPKPRYLANNNGNTPLHWALQNKRWAAARTLLKSCSEYIDVLGKNEFGFSVLSEALNNQPPVPPEKRQHPPGPNSDTQTSTYDNETASSSSIFSQELEDTVSEVLRLILEHPTAEALECPKSECLSRN